MPSRMENRYMFRHPLRTARAFFDAWRASRYTERYFGVGASLKDGGRANAFKHALWNALMARALGYDAAKRYGDAHEAGNVTSRALYLGIPEAEHSEMDLYNNEMGRRLASDAQKSGDDSAKTLARLALDYAKGPDAYFRFVTKDKTKTLEEARPARFEEVRSALGAWDTKKDGGMPSPM